jgi:hypothetical protein
MFSQRRTDAQEDNQQTHCGTSLKFQAAAATRPILARMNAQRDLRALRPHTRKLNMEATPAAQLYQLGPGGDAVQATYYQRRLSIPIGSTLKSRFYAKATLHLRGLR